MNVSVSEGALSDAQEQELAGQAEALLALLGHEVSELSLSLVGDDEMARLNSEWRGREGPTDVLSFSLLSGDHSAHRGDLLGDVVIDVPVAARQAAERHDPLADELLRLLVHGVLHLLGHDHEEPEPAARMQAEERRLLAVLSPGTAPAVSPQE